MAGTIEHIHAVKWTNLCRLIPQTWDIFLIGGAHDYRTVIIGKTNFSPIHQVSSKWVSGRLGKTAYLWIGRGDLGENLARSREMWPQPAPPGCGLSTSAVPKAFGAVTPAGIVL